LYKVSYPSIDLADVLSLSDGSLIQNNEDDSQDSCDDKSNGLSNDAKMTRQRSVNQWVKKGFIRP